jgi:hypothetical protein
MLRYALLDYSRHVAAFLHGKVSVAVQSTPDPRCIVKGSLSDARFVLATRSFTRPDTRAL